VSNWTATLTASFSKLTPIQKRRLANFRANGRGFWSLWLFLLLFGLALMAEVIANDSPLLMSYQGQLYAPVVQDIPEETFGGFLPTTADYRDPFIADEINANGWMLWPPHSLQLQHHQLHSGRAVTGAAQRRKLARNRRPGSPMLPPGLFMAFAFPCCSG